MRASLRTLSLVTPWVLLGCEELGYYPYDCFEHNACGDNCPGQCVPLPPIGFGGPALLWIGREADAPRCPDRASKLVYEGHGDLDASTECAPCQCTEPACVLPSGVTASSSPMCQGPGFVELDAPAGWDGSCASPATVQPAQLGSVTIAPPTVVSCAPVIDHVTTADLGVASPWGVFARACAGEAIPRVCDDPGLTCLPSAEPPPPGFRQCIAYLRDDHPPCPADYPDEHLFFGGLEDTRACTACECTPTAPSDCSASVSIYADDGCATWLASGLVTDAPSCHDVPAGMGVGSMAATWVTQEPGACEASGGVAVGEATPVTPTMFCCQ